MDKLNELARYTDASFSLEYNEHKSVYEAAQSYHNGPLKYDEVGAIDWDKDIWVLQVYPKTPVGFIAGISNDLDALVNWAIKGAQEY